MKKTFPILMLLIAAFASCNEECGECPPSPEALSITFLHKDSVVDPVYAGMVSADSVQIEYDDQGKSKSLHCNIVTDEARGQVHFQLTEIGFLCRRGTEDFRLKLNGETMNLKIQFRQKTDSEKCCTRYAAETVSLGGSKLFVDELPDYGGMLVEVEL